MPLDYISGDVDKVIATHKFAIVNFTASWCGPCKMIAPQFEALSKTNTHIYFCKVDIDDNEDAASKQ